MTINNEYAYAAALLVFVISIIFIVVQIMISLPKIKGFLTYKWAIASFKWLSIWWSYKKDSKAWPNDKGKMLYYFRDKNENLKVSRYWWSKAVKKSKGE